MRGGAAASCTWVRPILVRFQLANDWHGENDMAGHQHELFLRNDVSTNPKSLSVVHLAQQAMRVTDMCVPLVAYSRHTNRWTVSPGGSTSSFNTGPVAGQVSVHRLVSCIFGHFSRFIAKPNVFARG
jgi:hypothetical protein